MAERYSLTLLKPLKNSQKNTQVLLILAAEVWQIGGKTNTKDR